MYKGYQLKIGELTLPCMQGFNTNIVENGSYSFTRVRRVINDWQDANGKFHHETYRTPKTVIAFNIKERTKDQHALLKPLFENYEDIEVEYWDDNEGEYKTGVFFMDDIEAISSIATPDNIYYAPINIKLTEY